MLYCAIHCACFGSQLSFATVCCTVQCVVHVLDNNFLSPQCAVLCNVLCVFWITTFFIQCAVLCNVSCVLWITHTHTHSFVSPRCAVLCCAVPTCKQVLTLTCPFVVNGALWCGNMCGGGNGKYSTRWASTRRCKCSFKVCCYKSRVGQNRIYTVHVRYFWQGNHE